MFKNICKFILMILGCLIASFGTACFLLPNKLSSGGFSGIATVLYYFFEINMSTTIILLNIPIILLAYKKIGKIFIIKTIFSTFLYSIFLDIFSATGIRFTEDILLACIYGGIIIGFGLAIVYKTNSSTGGTDLIAHIAQKYNKTLKISEVIVGFDTIIVFINLILFKNIEIGLYSFISIFLIGKMTDIIFEGINFSKMIYIISDKNDEIRDKVINESNKGLTEIYAKGGYIGNNKKIIMCVTKRNHIMKIKELAHEIDKEAFIIITDVREVYGLGFK